MGMGVLWGLISIITGLIADWDVIFELHGILMVTCVLYFCFLYFLHNKKINNKLKVADRRAGRKVPRTARFVCALAVAWPNGSTMSFKGTVNGDLCWPPRGDNGFGYDPIFMPKDRSETFGEIEPSLKHAISHRADAFEKLKNSLFGQ